MPHLVGLTTAEIQALPTSGTAGGGGGGITSFDVESIGGDVRATWSPDSTGLTLRRERWVGTGTPS